MRRVSLIAGLLALVSLLAPVRGADAATQSVTATLTTTIDFWDDLTRLGNPENPPRRVEVWAPIAPPCGAAPCPGPSATRPGGAFDTRSVSVGNCVLEDSAVVAPQFCNATFDGDLVGFGLPGVTGAWCGFAWGNMAITLTTPTRTYQFHGLTQGISHTGPTFEWRLTKPGGQLGDNVGVAVGAVIGSAWVDAGGVAHPADCGRMAPDFRPSNRYEISLDLVWADPA